MTMSDDTQPDRLTTLLRGMIYGHLYQIGACTSRIYRELERPDCSRAFVEAESARLLKTAARLYADAQRADAWQAQPAADEPAADADRDTPIDYGAWKLPPAP
jgi:hypothetical protein